MSKMYHLQPRVYDAEDILQLSDQVSLPIGVWEELMDSHPDENPILIEVGETVLGRIYPDNDLEADTMRLPSWMWSHLGEPTPDMWIPIRMKRASRVGKVVLRARQETTVTGVEEPIQMLTNALTGSLANPSWACLTMGAELPLACGVFDVIDLKDTSQNPIPYGCILDCDVNLEFIRALDAEPEPPVVVPSAPPAMEENDTFPLFPPSIITPNPLSTKKFVPFTGKGHRLDGKA
jgi:hypothetical protein